MAAREDDVLDAGPFESAVSEPETARNGEVAAADPSSRVAAIDLGKVRVGVAVSDELGLLAHARPPLAGANRRALLRALRQLAEDDQITRFLVGLPLEMSGQHGPAAGRAARFAQQLADATGREVELVDERLTSRQAERQLRAGGATRQQVRQKVDGAAAIIMLQQYLDGRR